jgi:hypothetical protein
MGAGSPRRRPRATDDERRGLRHTPPSGVGATAPTVYADSRRCGGRRSSVGEPAGSATGPTRLRRRSQSAARTAVPVANMPATATAGRGAEGGDPRLQDTTAQLLTGGGGGGATTVVVPAAVAWDTMTPGTRQHSVTAAAAAISQRLIGAMGSRLSLPVRWQVARGIRGPESPGVRREGAVRWPTPLARGPRRRQGGRAGAEVVVGPPAGGPNEWCAVASGRFVTLWSR